MDCFWTIAIATDCSLNIDIAISIVYLRIIVITINCLWSMAIALAFQWIAAIAIVNIYCTYSWSLLINNS